MIETITLVPTPRGGKRISILKTGNFHVDENLKNKCNKVSKGLYIWTHITNIDFISKDKANDEIRPYIISESEDGFFIQKKGTWLKPGQYGENTENGIRPIDTIDSYSSGQQDAIVIIDIHITNTPYKLEQEAWHSNPVFKSRKDIDGFGTEKIYAPISEIRNELNKIINTSNFEKFNEKKISIDIRNDLFLKVLESFKNKKKSTFACLLHPRFAKTGFTLQLVNDLVKYYKDLVFILFSDDYTVYGSYKDWIEKKRCWGDSIKFIDAGSENLEEVINWCKNNNVIPFVKVGSKTNQSKTDYLKKIQSNKKIMFVEEADFGSWTDNNKERSKSLDCDIIVLESGTGIDKISFGRKIDEIFQLDITDALMIKKGIHPLSDYNKYQSDYKNFPFPKFHDINFSIPMRDFQKNISDESKTSLNKMFKNVNSNSEFILSFFKSVFAIPDPNNIESFNFYNTRQNSFQYVNDLNKSVSLISLSPGISNKELNRLRKLLLSDKLMSERFEIIVLNGDITTREESEKYTIGALREFKTSGKSVLILAANMGKRSYSISEIKNVFIMYDSGSEDMTGQIIARGSTEGYQYDGDVKEYYNVICCSINQNRETASVLDLFLMNKIGKLLNTFKLTTEEATSLILACFPLNIIDEQGITFNNVDYKDFINRNPKSEVYIKAAISGINLDLLSEENIAILEKSGLKSEFISDLSENKLDLKGLKTKLKSKKSENIKSQRTDLEKEEIEKSIKILEALIFIIESSFAMKFFLNREGNFSIKDELYEIKSLGLKEKFEDEYKVDIELCIGIIEDNAIDSNLINASVDEKIIELGNLI
jgi:nitrogen regulatory protein PII-like uncharacterized protein